MKTQYQLNPKDYKVGIATITISEISEMNAMDYLKVTLKYDTGAMQDYPAWNVREPLADVVNNFIEFLQVNSLKEGKNKKVYALTSDNEIFALFNPKTNQFFSLQARFYPEMYSEAFEKILEQNPQLNVAHLDTTESLLMAFVACMPVKDDLSRQMNKIAHNYMQYKHLSETIIDKTNEPTIKKKI